MDDIQKESFQRRMAEQLKEYKKLRVNNDAPNSSESKAERSIALLKGVNQTMREMSDACATEAEVRETAVKAHKDANLYFGED